MVSDPIDRLRQMRADKAAREASDARAAFKEAVQSLARGGDILPEHLDGVLRLAGRSPDDLKSCVDLQHKADAAEATAPVPEKLAELQSRFERAYRGFVDEVERLRSQGLENVVRFTALGRWIPVADSVKPLHERMVKAEESLKAARRAVKHRDELRSLLEIAIGERTAPAASRHETKGLVMTTHKLEGGEPLGPDERRVVTWEGRRPVLKRVKNNAAPTQIPTDGAQFHMVKRYRHGKEIPLDD